MSLDDEGEGGECREDNDSLEAHSVEALWTFIGVSACVKRIENGKERE